MVERKEARAGEQLAASINRMGRKRKGLFRKPLFRRPEEEGTQKYALKEGREGGRPKEKEGNCNVAAASPPSLLEPFPKGEFVFPFIPRDIPRKGAGGGAGDDPEPHIISPRKNSVREGEEEGSHGGRSLPSSYPLFPFPSLFYFLIYYSASQLAGPSLSLPFAAFGKKGPGGKGRGRRGEHMLAGPSHSGALGIKRRGKERCIRVVGEGGEGSLCWGVGRRQEKKYSRRLWQERALRCPRLKGREGGDEKTWFIPEGGNFNPKIPPSFGVELFPPSFFPGQRGWGWCGTQCSLSQAGPDSLREAQLTILRPRLCRRE